MGATIPATTIVERHDAGHSLSHTFRQYGDLVWIQDVRDHDKAIAPEMCERARHVIRREERQPGNAVVCFQVAPKLNDLGVV